MLLTKSADTAARKKNRPSGKQLGNPRRFATIPFKIKVSDLLEVSALLTVPPKTKACYVMAHGAGAGMRHPFMAAVADGLAERELATLRYQFSFAETGSKRPDTPALAHATARAAVAEASLRLPTVPLIAGGKSFGGRMTSQAQAEALLPNVIGLAFVGFPLHPAGRPSAARAEHLSAVAIPMLFLQGSRDALADLPLMKAVVTNLGRLATLKVIDGADHSFHVLARSGRTDPKAMSDILDAISEWIGTIERAN